MKIRVSSGVRVKRTSTSYTARKRPVRTGKPGAALGVNVGRRTRIRVF